MSEYQYYEFRAVDVPLTKQQMAELRDCSTRAEISPTGFVNYYNWGDLKGDPDQWMEKYFDAHLYLANWGTRVLKLRLPERLLDPDIADDYCEDEWFSCRTKGDHLIFSFHSEEEDTDWDDEEGWLGALVLLRSDLMQGDYRCLYIGWLLAVQQGQLDDDDTEPPVPAGLGALNAPLETLVEFLRIDRDLVTAAAERSGKKPAGGLASEDISRWVTGLPPEEKDAALIKLLEGDDPHFAVEFRHRALSEIRAEGEAESGPQKDKPRSVGELLARTEVIYQQRRKREAEQHAHDKALREQAEAAERKRYLELLAGKENALWAEVDALIARKHAAPYDEAVRLLKDLRDLSKMQGNASEFKQRMRDLYREHENRTALTKRYDEAKLLD
ncbi:hypothetical protein ACFL2Q_06445 [Thermodesulfobacteriota bacterium]